MPRQHTHTVYTYDELSPEAQQVAREWWLDNVLTNDVQFYLWDSIDDLLTEDVKALGYETVEWKSDAWSNFSVEVMGDVDKAIVFPRAGIDFVDPSDVNVWVAPRNINYGRERPEVVVEIQFDEDDLKAGERSIEDLETRIKTMIEEDRKEVADLLKTTARAEYDYVHSDDAVAENIYNNEHEFYENGRPFRS